MLTHARTAAAPESQGSHNSAPARERRSARDPAFGGEPARAVVIGAGFGGLAAAMRLGAKGYRVTVVDRLETPGGRATAHHADGHRFDLGPTIVTAPEVFRDLWAATGRNFDDDVDLRALDPFYEVRFPDGAAFKASSSQAALDAQIERLAPGDRAGYARLMRDSRRRYAFGFEGLGRRPMHRAADLIKALPGFARLRADRSVYGHVSGRVRDPRLRMALSFHPLFIGGDPFNVTSVYTLVAYLEKMFGVHYAMGGAGAIAEAMATVIRDQGGALRLGEDVDEILVDEGRGSAARAAGVRLASGERLAADIVVSNADPGHTYAHLLRRRPRRRWTDARLKRSKWSMGLFVWHFGVKGSRGLWPDVGHHTILNGPRYGGLVRDIFRHGVLAEDMSLYIHRPSVTDPTCAPEGDDTFYALSPVPHLGFDNGVDWREEGERYRRRVAARLEAELLPGFAQRLSASHFMTPLDFESRYLSPYGCGFSIEPRILQSAFFRPHNRSEELPGLYLVGAGTHPGAGLPGVICSAEVVAKDIPNAGAALEPARSRRLEAAAPVTPPNLKPCLIPSALLPKGPANGGGATMGDPLGDLARNAALPRGLRQKLAAVCASGDAPPATADIDGLRGLAARRSGALAVAAARAMGVDGRDALARAADLGLALELTQIAGGLIDAPALSAETRRRLRRDVERLIRRAEAGVALLPVRARPAAFAALGAASTLWRRMRDRERRAPFDRPTPVRGWAKAALSVRALLATAATLAMPRSALIHAAPAPEAAPFVDAAAKPLAATSPWGEGRAGALVSVFAALAEHDAGRRAKA